MPPPRSPGWTLLALAACLLVPVALTSGGVAQDAAQAPAPDARYVGRYRYAETTEVARRRIRRAVTPVLDRMNPVFRAIASSRVDEAEVPARIEIALSGAAVAITYAGEDERTFESRLGYPMDVTHDSGRTSRMTQLFRDGHLEQIFQGERGRWYNVFTLAERDPSRLLLDVTITGERLDAPIRLALPYSRVP